MRHLRNFSWDLLITILITKHYEHVHILWSCMNMLSNDVILQQIIQQKGYRSQQLWYHKKAICSIIMFRFIALLWHLSHFFVSWGWGIIKFPIGPFRDFFLYVSAIFLAFQFLIFNELVSFWIQIVLNSNIQI